MTKLRVGLIGLGKMGLSHLAIARSHPLVDVVGLCDQNGIVLAALQGYTGARAYKDYRSMFEAADLDAVIISTPPNSHGELVQKALEARAGVFCEKPFMLDWEESERLALLAADRGVANQVGYHNRFVATFALAKTLLSQGMIGVVSHAKAEAYGPVVLRSKGGTWRSKSTFGGGCLYDYAAHPLNLLTWYFGPAQSVQGSFCKSIFSNDTDDEVYSTIEFGGGLTAQLSVNWSDASQRKMATSISIWGTSGQLYADRQELRLFLRESPSGLTEYEKGWNVRYTTDLTPQVQYYLRGEEYTAQLDHFFECIRGGSLNRNSFSSAAETDRLIAMIGSDNSRRLAVQKRDGRAG